MVYVLCMNVHILTYGGLCPYVFTSISLNKQTAVRTWVCTYEIYINFQARDTEQLAPNDPL